MMLIFCKVKARMKSKLGVGRKGSARFSLRNKGGNNYQVRWGRGWQGGMARGLRKQRFVHLTRRAVSGSPVRRAQPCFPPWGGSGRRPRWRACGREPGSTLLGYRWRGVDFPSSGVSKGTEARLQGEGSRVPGQWTEPALALANIIPNILLKCATAHDDDRDFLLYIFGRVFIILLLKLLSHE